ncbi:hypothetical protein [Gordonia bronchialis]|uniref:hypothetical protein n=1 Tax=Gordonia bronchialis TaxID=2054 RepID=UPI00242EC0CF|nr:hypothetical protein [Gordonia bronchialis]
MSERWIDLPNASSSEEQLCRIIEQLHAKFRVFPELQSADSMRACVVELMAQRDALAGDLWNNRADRVGGLSGSAAVRVSIEVLDEATQLVVGELVSRVPAKSVHEQMNGWAYLEAEVQQPVADAGPLADSKLWRERAASAHLDSLERLGYPDDYVGDDLIEDIAVPPDVVWTDADRKEALDKAIAVYGLDPGEWYTLEWPPTEASLWSTGEIMRTNWEPCGEHEDKPDTDEAAQCVSCAESVQETVVEHAVWKFVARLTKLRLGFDADGTLVDDFGREEIDARFEVRELLQDPREILIGPPGRGRRW